MTAGRKKKLAKANEKRLQELFGDRFKKCYPNQQSVHHSRNFNLFLAKRQRQSSEVGAQVMGFCMHRVRMWNGMKAGRGEYGT